MHNIEPPAFQEHAIKVRGDCERPDLRCGDETHRTEIQWVSSPHSSRPDAKFHLERAQTVRFHTETGPSLLRKQGSSRAMDNNREARFFPAGSLQKGVPWAGIGNPLAVQGERMPRAMREYDCTDMLKWPVPPPQTTRAPFSEADPGPPEGCLYPWAPSEPKREWTKTHRTGWVDYLDVTLADKPLLGHHLGKMAIHPSQFEHKQPPQTPGQIEAVDGVPIVQRDNLNHDNYQTILVKVDLGHGLCWDPEQIVFNNVIEGFSLLTGHSPSLNGKLGLIARGLKRNYRDKKGKKSKILEASASGAPNDDGILNFSASQSHLSGSFSLGVGLMEQSDGVIQPAVQTLDDEGQEIRSRFLTAIGRSCVKLFEYYLGKEEVVLQHFIGAMNNVPGFGINKLFI